MVDPWMIDVAEAVRAGVDTVRMLPDPFRRGVAACASALVGDVEVARDREPKFRTRMPKPILGGSLGTGQVW